MPAAPLPPYHFAFGNFSLMTNGDNRGGELSAQGGRIIPLLECWRDELLLHEDVGDTDAMELDRRILDYYLDLYREAAVIPSPDFRARRIAAEGELDNQPIAA